MGDEKRIIFDNLGRKEARDKVIKLPRDRLFVVDSLSDGRKIYIRTDGAKTSRVNGEVISGIDITIHYEGESRRKISYVNDVMVDMIKKHAVVDYVNYVFKDMIKKEEAIGKDGMLTLLNAIKEFIELTPYDEIKRKYPDVDNFDRMNLPGNSIEFLFKIIRYLALQEDVNYWGVNSNTGKNFEGREKPYNALCDLFVKGMPLTHVTRKHRLY